MARLCGGRHDVRSDRRAGRLPPIVQPVPDFHFNTLLGQVFEAQVGGGSLLVCGYDLAGNLDQRPAARQFRRSLFRYVASERFARQPSCHCRGSKPAVGAGLASRGAKVLRVSSEDHASGNVAANLLDGDPATFWHSRWQPQNDPMPHELIVDLGRELTLRGVTCLPRQDQSNGRIAGAEVFAAQRSDDWVSPVASARRRQPSD